MISPVSFGSTYKLQPINDDAKLKGYQQTMTYCEKNHISNKEEYTHQYNKQTGRYYFALTSTIVAPDDRDANIEKILNNYGINFYKIDTKEITKPLKIESRIAPPQEGYKLVKVNSEKLDKYLTEQMGNFEHCENDYNKYYKEDTNFMLKSGDVIVAPTLYITPASDKKSLTDYINVFGANNLNPNSIYFDLSQRSDYPDHCMFFAMKDTGMKNIPVYLNQDSYDIAKELGLLV